MKYIYIFSHRKRIKCIFERWFNFTEPFDTKNGQIIVVNFSKSNDPRTDGVPKPSSFPDVKKDIVTIERTLGVPVLVVNIRMGSIFKETEKEEFVSFVFIRHGKAQHNEAKEQHRKGLFYNQRDTLLTFKGQQELVDAGVAFKKVKQPTETDAEIVLVSDLQRTHQSAKAFFSTWDRKPQSYTVFPCIFEISSRNGSDECVPSFITASENTSLIPGRETNCQNVNVFKLAYDFLSHPSKYSYPKIQIEDIRPAVFDTVNAVNHANKFKFANVHLNKSEEETERSTEAEKKSEHNGVVIYFPRAAQKLEYEEECKIEHKCKRGDYEFTTDVDKTYTSVFQSHMNAVRDEIARIPHKDGLYAGACGSDCLKFKAFWTHESKSTFYMLRFFCNSVMQHPSFPISITIQKFSYLWSQCAYSINIPSKVRRVIMGVGPSGCGKSTVAKSIFTAFTREELDTVIAIDGGISRETSIAWMIASKYNKTNGIRDLYEIFNGISETKTVLFDILKSDQYKCSFYIPETLASITKFTSKYTSLDPNWIAIVIWQHLHCDNKSCSRQSDCPYPENYRCEGCDIQGRQRALSEGKIYNSNAYKMSMYFAYRLMNESNCRFFVHNSGSRDRKSVVVCDNKYGTLIQEKNPNTVVNFQIERFPGTYQELDDQMKTKLEIKQIQTPRHADVSPEFAKSFNDAVSTIVGPINENFRKLGVKPMYAPILAHNNHTDFVSELRSALIVGGRANCKSVGCSTRKSFATQKVSRPASVLAGKYTRRRRGR